MGELLRAVLDQSCIDSRPAFYTAQITSDVPNTGTTTYGARNGLIECKPDTWFLMMSASRFIQNGGVAGSTASISPDFTTMRLRSLKTGASLSRGATPQYLQNATLNNCRTDDEYTLWEPSDLIGVTLDVPVTSNFAGQFYSFVVLAGIEYRFDQSRDWQNGG